MSVQHNHRFPLVSFTGSVGEIAHQSFKVIQRTLPIAKVLRLLKKPSNSYLVVTRNDIPIGVITKKDILSRNIHDANAYKFEIEDLMNAFVVSAQHTQPVLKALMFMLKSNMDYLIVLDKNKTIGILQQQDWITLQTNYPYQLINHIESANSILELIELCNHGKSILMHNYNKESSTTSLTSISTWINDAILNRIIQLCLEKMLNIGLGHPPCEFVWLGMGSEGRKAQTIHTDQDNGIIFEDVSEKEFKSTHEWFLEFGKLVVNDLNLCGFSFCDGQIMANNPKLCNSLHNWKDQFRRIIKKADQKELLEASIYFDFRGIYGNKQLVLALWTDLYKTIDNHVFFKRYFAENMLEASRPPIKKWQWKVCEFSSFTPPPFNIKREALAPLDAAIRLLALHAEIKETNTLARLQRLLELGAIPKILADEVYVTFDFIFRLRLKLEFSLNNDSNNNPYQLETKTLNRIELANLKYALTKIYNLQSYAFKQVAGFNVPWSMK